MFISYLVDFKRLATFSKKLELHHNNQSFKETVHEKLKILHKTYILILINRSHLKCRPI